MAQDYAVAFYNSKAWKKTRADAYARDKGLCVECLKRGQVNAADIVHHIEHVSPDNVSDPNITLNLDNLVSVCRKCHARLHGYTKSATRDGLYFDELGNLRQESTLGEGLS